MSSLRILASRQPDELREARADLERARRGLQQAREIAERAGPDQRDPFGEAEQDQAIRVFLARRRLDEAIQGEARERRARSRRDRWRGLFGIRRGATPPPRILETPYERPPMTPEGAMEAHRATVAFVRAREAEAHSAEEDLHPSRLDRAEDDLDRILTDRK